MLAFDMDEFCFEFAINEEETSEGLMQAEGAGADDLMS